MTIPPLPSLPPELTQRGGSPDLVKAEYLHQVKIAIDSHPRSLQRRIGPSELGHPCSRRIGYKLLDFDDLNQFPDTPWLPTVGTAVHAWLEDVFIQANRGHDHARWVVESRVHVGDVGGQPVTGSCDLYDRVTAFVIDHKVVGPTQLRKYKTNGPGDQYRKQIHLYGRGLRARGAPVDHVGIAFLPRNGELRDTVFWHEPYDEQVALDALKRANDIAITTQQLGAQALQFLGTADAWCARCPYYRPNSTDLKQGCPGDPGSQTTPTPALTLGGGS